MAQKILDTKIVLRNSTASEWATVNPVLLLGELGLETDTGKFKFGDGLKAWKELAYYGADSAVAKHYEATATAGQSDMEALAAIVGTDTLKDGMTAVVKRELSTDKYSYTAYVYGNNAWKAMDGNYSADNVYFENDITYTTAVGTLKPGTSGSGTLSASGKSVSSVLSSILAKEENPTTTQPSAAISLPAAKGYEIGTSVTPAYTATFKAGSYKYGPATGVTVTSWEISDTAGNSATTASGNLPAVVVAADTHYKVTAKANFGEGAIPKTNLGNDYAAGQIKAGSTSATSGEIYGYRNTFYGTVTEKAVVTSTIVRGLVSKSNKALKNGDSFNITIPVGAVRVIFAYPATLRDVNSVKDVNGMGAQVKSAFTQSSLVVAGAGEDAGIEYKVYVTDFAEAVTKANTYAVQI